MWWQQQQSPSPQVKPFLSLYVASHLLHLPSPVAPPAIAFTLLSPPSSQKKLALHHVATTALLAC
jgi:hypothetical protein